MERASSSSSSSSDSSFMASSSSSSDHSLSITSDHTLPSVTSSMLSRTSSSSSSAVGDYIGTESCFDVLSGDEENEVVSASEPVSRYRYGGRRREEREARAAAAREFPPPIPLLAQTENLLPHMPWVLKRVVTSDGRLILREEKVRHHEYFRAHRSNGRLTLHLVPLDDNVFGLPQEPSHYQSDDDDGDYEHDDGDYEHDDGEHDECDDDDDDDDQVLGDDLDDLADNVRKSVIITAPNDDDDDDDGEKCNVHGDSEDGYRKAILAVVAEETMVESGGMIGGGGSPRGKCLKSCFVGMRVREIRPVLS